MDQNHGESKLGWEVMRRRQRKAVNGAGKSDRKLFLKSGLICQESG